MNNIKVGDKLHLLTILSFHKEYTPKQSRTMVMVECECGNRPSHLIRLTSIVQGKTVSCGCSKAKKARERTTIRNTKHGLSGHPLYTLWKGMIGRCKFKSHIGYKNYGGRGIIVCDEWKSFQLFFDWSLLSGWKIGLTIDRIDQNGNYCPDNCKWSTIIQQSNNRRSNRLVNAFGETKTVAEWSRDSRCKSNYGAILSRLKSGWITEDAISTPTRKLNRIFL